MDTHQKNGLDSTGEVGNQDDTVNDKEVDIFRGKIEERASKLPLNY